jgi:very-short-patch-repair endonuclease
MPKKGYKQTKEHKEKSRKFGFQKGIHPKTEFQKGQKAWNKGIKGLCKSNSGSFQKGEHKSSKTEFKKGNKIRLGITHTEETIKKIRQARKGQINTVKGKHWKIKNTSKMGKGRKGRKYPHSEKTKNKLRKWNINNPNRKFKDTSIELKIEAELKKREINYQKQIPLCNIAIVDFYLPEYRIVIQCDGEYYHNLSWQKERDERQDKVLTFNGFNIYRFWEHEINESPEKCINLLDFLNK